jgi:hypothetical protein
MLASSALGTNVALEIAAFVEIHATFALANGAIPFDAFSSLADVVDLVAKIEFRANVHGYILSA